MLCLYSVGSQGAIECIFFRKQGYNLCTIETRPLCVFFASLIQQGSTCAQYVWRWVQRPVGRNVFNKSFRRGLSVMIELWYDVNTWPFRFVSPFQTNDRIHCTGWSTITDTTVFCAAVTLTLRAAWISSTSAFSFVAIESRKWRLLAFTVLLDDPPQHPWRCFSLAKHTVRPLDNGWQNDGSVLPYWRVDL